MQIQSLPKVYGLKNCKYFLYLYVFIINTFRHLYYVSCSLTSGFDYNVHVFIHSDITSLKLLKEGLRNN